MKFLVLILALAQIPFIIHNPAFWWNSVALGFCSAAFINTILNKQCGANKNIEPTNESPAKSKGSA